MRYSPIILFAYNRPIHLQRTLDALKKNKFADKSDLYVFADGAKNSEDEKNVNKVRDIIKDINGFRDVIVNYQNKNVGLRDAIINGVTQVINERNSVIVLEDDIITSPFFLEYMNSALNFSKGRDDIFSVTGFNYPINIPENYKLEFFLLYRASSLGWGTRKTTWNSFMNFNPDFSDFLNSKTLQTKFNIEGDDLTPMLKSQIIENNKSWVILWTFYHFQNNGFCLYPVKTLLRHIGEDTGTHKIDVRKINSAFDPNIKLKLEFKLDGALNTEIEKEVRRLFKLSIIRKIINIFKYDFNSKILSSNKIY